MEKEKFYITSAIAYTSRKPHIGNTYEIVLTDAIARFKRLMGYDVFFLTGTDEHGQKIEEIAKNEHISCKEHVDKISGQIRDIWNLMNASYDKFIRTTDDYHEKAVQKIFNTIRATFIKENMRVCTVCRAKRFSHSHSLLTANAPTADAKLFRRRKRHISLK